MKFEIGKKYQVLKFFMNWRDISFEIGEILECIDLGGGKDMGFNKQKGTYHAIDQEHQTSEYFELYREGYEVIGDGNNWCRSQLTATAITNKLKRTHTAFVSNIQPIKKETKEEKLEKIAMRFVDLWDQRDPKQDVNFTEIYDDAKKVLEDK